MDIETQNRLLITPTSGRPRFSRLEREKLLRLGIEAALEDLELQPLLTKVVEQACRLLGADDGSVGLLFQEPKRFVVTAVHNLPDSEIHSEWRPGEGLAGLILSSGRPLIINRYGDIDPQNRPELAEHAVVGVPITRRKKLVGFFGIGAKPPRRFTQSDVQTLSQFARACGIAIENARLFASTQESLTQTQLLYSTATILSQATQLDDVVGAYLVHIAQSAKMNCNVVVYERDDRGEIAWNVSRGRCGPDGKVDQNWIQVRHDSDALDEVLETGQTVLINDVRKDSKVPSGLRDLQISEGNLSLALIPLVSRGRRVGLVTLSRREPHEWQDNEIHRFSVTSAHLAAAVDIRKEQELLADERAQLALVEERKRLARDLHDSVTQSLFAMQLLSQAIMDETTDVGREKAEKLADLSRTSLREMRALLSELRPLEDVPGGNAVMKDTLRDKILRHAGELATNWDVRVEDKSFRGASDDMEHALFRIAQESLTNAHKHSGSRAVQIKIATLKGKHVLEVRDSGRGFSQSESSPRRYGLLGMRERAESLGGKLTVDSQPGKGVKIRAEVPLETS